VERFQVDNPRKKFWQTTRKRDHPNADTTCFNIGRYITLDNIPNSLAKVVWSLDRDRAEGTFALQFRTPVLCWAKVFTCEEGQIVRFA